MGLRRVEAEEELQGPPEKYYHIWTKTPHHIPDVTAKNVQSVERHDDGKVEAFKETIEFDDANLKVTHVAVGGDVLKIYKSYRVGWQFIPKGNGTLAKITIEYEKLSDDMPDAINYLNLAVDMHKDIETHLIKA
ncbi:hypothetical protein ACFE04_029522 [Oxalis oulophora]